MSSPIRTTSELRTLLVRVSWHSGINYEVVFEALVVAQGLLILAANFKRSKPTAPSCAAPCHLALAGTFNPTVRPGKPAASK